MSNDLGEKDEENVFMPKLHGQVLVIVCINLYSANYMMDHKI